MTADNAVRVERRFNELYAKNPNVTLEEVRNNLEMRDYIDSNRKLVHLSKLKMHLYWTIQVLQRKSAIGDGIGLGEGEN